ERDVSDPPHVGTSWHAGGGLEHGVMQQLPWSCWPAGQVPASLTGPHACSPPQVHSCTQYCVAAHDEVPHAKGPSAGGSAPSVDASWLLPPPVPWPLLELHAAMHATSNERVMPWVHARRCA